MVSINNPYYVYVNSRNRLDGTDSDFSYNVKFPPGLDVDHVTVLNALIPKSYYLIQLGHNTFDLQEGNSIVTIPIPVGNYLLNAFRLTLQGLLNNYSPNGWTYAVTYPSSSGADTGKYTYSVIGFSSPPAIIVQDHVFEPLGFSQNTVNTFNNIGVLESANVLKLQSEDRLLIHSNIVNNPGFDDILVSINAATNVNFSSISYVNYAPEYNAKLLNKNLNTYRFTILNEDGRILALNGLNMNITLLFYKRDIALQQIRDFIKVITEK